MYIPVTKSCAVRGAGGPDYCKPEHKQDYKRNNATANMLLDMSEHYEPDDKIQSAMQKQVGAYQFSDEQQYLFVYLAICHAIWSLKQSNGQS